MLGICEICKNKNIEVKFSTPNPELFVENPESIPNELNLCIDCFVKHMIGVDESDEAIIQEARQWWNRLD